MISYCRSQFEVMEAQLSNLKDDLEKERQKSRAAQANYERQVFLKVSSRSFFFFYKFSFF